MIGNTRVASAYTFTGLASARIFPHDTASSGRAPASEPSYSCPVLIYTEKSAPFLCVMLCVSECRVGGRGVDKGIWWCLEIEKIMKLMFYHEISICGMMLDNPTTQNNHASLVSKHSLVINSPDIAHQIYN